MSRLPLTVVIPVKNEARNLPACLTSIGDVAAVVVVDSNSTDETRAIAAAAGASVLAFDWQGGFPKKRSWVLMTHRFETDWVLFLDADERLTPQVLAALPGALARTDVVGYWLKYTNHFMGKVMRHGVPQRKLALFRVGAGLFERIEDAGWSSLDMEVHEHPVLQGKIGEIDAPIEHNDFRGIHHFIARHNDYSTWEAHRYQAMVADKSAWSSLTPRQRFKYRSLTRWWFAPVYFLITYVAKLGFLDGHAGLAYAIQKYGYFFDVRLKILELCGKAR